MANATGSASCLAQNEAVILIGQYSSNFGLDNDVARLPGSYYATAEANSGQTWVFLAPNSGNRGEAALEPLKQYRFEIQQVSR